jgi:HK97 family phage portal protein
MPISDPASAEIFGGGGTTAAGVNVQPRTALASAPVQKCVRVIAVSAAQLPLHTYQNLAGGGKKRATDSSLYYLLHNAPNDEMSSMEMREAITGHVLLWGNGYMHKEFSADGSTVGALWPLLPASTFPYRRADGQLVYLTTIEKTGETRWLRADEVLHVKNFSYNGIIGYSVIQLCPEAVGLQLAQQTFAALFYGQGATLKGVLKHPGTISEEGEKRLKESWFKKAHGLERAHLTAILEEGMEYQSLAMPLADAQFIESRKFQDAEVAGLFGVPPHMIQNLDNATFSNIEHQSIDFVVHCLGPWLMRWEQAINQRLLTEFDRQQGLFVEHLVDGLLRGDKQTRYAAYAVGRQNGWLNANDIRAWENMNPIPDEQGGNDYLVPLNMIPAGSASSLGPTKGAPPKVATILESRTVRARRSLVGRYRLSVAHRPAFADAAARVLRREQHDVLEAARKFLTVGQVQAFSAWAEKFYHAAAPDEKGHVAFVKLNMRATFSTYAKAIADEARDEVGSNRAEYRQDDPELDQFVDEYGNNFAKRHAATQLGRIKKALRDNPQDQLPAVEGELDTWDDDEAAGTAKSQTVSMAGAVSKFVYAAAGFSALRWVVMSDKPCPYCDAMDGEIIDIQDNFASAGDELEPDGADGPISVYSDVGHPELHPG